MAAFNEEMTGEEMDAQASRNGSMPRPRKKTLPPSPESGRGTDVEDEDLPPIHGSMKKTSKADSQPQGQNATEPTPPTPQQRAQAIREAARALSGLPVLDDLSLQRQQDQFDQENSK